MSDIVAELDNWLAQPRLHNAALIQRARDEIAATNEAIGRAAKEAYALGCADALEKAAQLVWSHTLQPLAGELATAIRALKFSEPEDTSCKAPGAPRG